MTGRGRPSGRRPGESGTREAILDAARRRFAAEGYDRTSLRAIALDAAVDPALVSHFYGSKQRLFARVVELPFDPAAVLPAILAGDPGTVGERFARFILGLLDSPDGRRRVIGMVRASASEPEAARMVRDLVERDVIAPIAASLDSDAAPLRAALVGSQVVGLVMARYIVAVEPLATAPAEDVIAAVGATFQRYLCEPLG